MKKYLCLVMAALLVLISMNAMAEEPAVGTEHAFDRSVFEGLDEYSEDKFDKTWSCTLIVQNPLRDLTLGMQIQGSLADSNIDPIMFWAGSADNAEGSEKIQALIGETVYSFDLSKMQELFDAGAIFFSDNNSSFFEAIANAEEVSFRVTIDGVNYDADFSSSDEEFSKIQLALQEIIRQGGTECYSASGADTIATVENYQCQVMTVD